ncbi:MAG TPA: TIGR02281 family clan AA aspartic protease [Xanthobacteraceae bacterium]|nr:TIGR02281 family clan AA aspartic protease [Xanthobacteraceae bacterium]
MRSFIAFAIVALVAAGLVPRYLDRPAGQAAPLSAPAVQTVASAPTAPAYSGGPRTVVIQRDARGHFAIEGAVDGRRVDFMVDTGASVIALTERDAGRLGYHPAYRDYVGQVRTANGTVRAAPIKLDMVEVGGVMVRNVDAIVMPEQALSENLLGLSFLSRLHRFEYRDGRLVLEE